MDHILLVESATDLCSVEVVDLEGKSKGFFLSDVAKSHDTALAPMVDEVLKKSGVGISGLCAVAVSEGPGSYMGLRIGVSLAKGIAYGAGLKLIGVGTLAALAQCALDKVGAGSGFTRIVPMIDAGRMEVYTAVYDGACNLLSEQKAEAKILDEMSFRDLISTGKVLFTGSGAPKFGKLLQETCPEAASKATFLDISPTASGMRYKAIAAFKESRFADLAYFQPFYLKEYIPGKQKKLL